MSEQPQPGARAADDCATPLAQALTQACIALLQNGNASTGQDLETVAALALRVATSLALPACQSLAFAVERVCDELALGTVDPGLALPLLCEAADLLLVTPPPLAVDAMRYRLDTLLPVRGVPAKSYQPGVVLLGTAANRRAARRRRLTGGQLPSQIAERRAAYDD